MLKTFLVDGTWTDSGKVERSKNEKQTNITAQYKYIMNLFGLFGGAESADLRKLIQPEWRTKTKLMMKLDSIFHCDQLNHVFAYYANFVLLFRSV